ncbi:MAG: serine/threonine-protein kinase, partial [Pseudomonadota bacterium]
MGEQFGKYELLYRIGVGGMAEVFVARTRGAEGFVKHVVIKRILPVFNEDPDFVRMFVREAQLAVQLQHANIVQIFDFDHVDGTYYMAMEWVDGTDLRRTQLASRDRNLPVPQTIAVHVGVETLKGLHYAHSTSCQGRPLRLVHRDISPHNLLVSFAGEVKIADFGIAKVAALASGTFSGTVKGKLAYMSPEQVNGEHVDQRSDLFSLGIVLWELLSGKRLYGTEGSEGELIAKVRRAKIPPLRGLNPGVPEELELVVNKMLAPAVEDRYWDAKEALADLSPFGGVEDAFQVAAYLKKLLPGEAEREAKGSTQVVSYEPNPVFSELPPDAETNIQDENATDISPIIFDGPEGQIDGQVMGRGGFKLFAVGVFALFGVVGWFLAGQPAKKLPVFAEKEMSEKRAKTSLGKKEIQLNDSEPATDMAIANQVKSGPTLHDQTTTVRLYGSGPDAGAVGEFFASSHGKAVQPPGKSSGLGKLDVVVDPWAEVDLDGRSLGSTPVRGHRLPIGRHVVELRNNGLRKKETIKINILPG